MANLFAYLTTNRISVVVGRRSRALSLKLLGSPLIMIATSAIGLIVVWRASVVVAILIVVARLLIAMTGKIDQVLFAAGVSLILFIMNVA